VSGTQTPVDALARSRYLSLTTFRRNGTAVATPVWFAPAEAGWFVFTAADCGKVKRLRHTSSVRLAACDMRGKVLGCTFETQAALTSDKADIEAGYAALERRYGWQLTVTNVLSWLGRRLHKRKLIRITPPKMKTV
jgi:uncharacterized protein